MREKFIIFGESDGMREDFKSERGEETVKEEVERLNNLDDGIKYDYRKAGSLKPKQPQANRLY